MACSRYGKVATGLVVTFSILLLAASLAWTVMTRLYLKGYYCSAHASALTVIVALFLFKQHLCETCDHKIMFSPFKAYLGIRYFTKILYILVLLAISLAYTVVIAKSIVINFDYLATVLWFWISTFVMLYSFLMLIYVDQVRDVPVGREFEMQVYTIGVTLKSEWSYDNPYMAHEQNGQTNQQRNSTDDTDDKSEGFSTCCGPVIVIIRVIYIFFYVLLHLIIICVFVSTAYNGIMMVKDIYQYRTNADMYVVEVQEHRPLALYMKCRGQGNDTILMENGFGALAMINWPFIPEILESKYKVCVYDRRGIGWSDGPESDYIKYILLPQNSDNNIDFAKALAEKANLTQPLYYAGHSYGGWHLVQMALKYPDFVKGLIFLDSSRFGTDDYLTLFEVLLNVQWSGALRVAIDLNLIDFQAQTKQLADMSEVPKPIVDTVLASMLSGTYFETFVRERKYMYTSKLRAEVRLPSSIIDKPVLVIDAGNGSDWFKKLQTSFPKYNERLHYKVAHGATHAGLVYSKKYATMCGKWIDEFIESSKPSMHVSV